MNKLIDKSLKVLKEDNSEKVKEAVSFLSLQGNSAYSREKLYEIIRNHWEHDDLSSLWSVVILGEMKDKEAIETLLKVFDSDEDYLIEAATEALIHIEIAWPGLVIPEIFYLIEERIAYDPYLSNLSAYEILEAFIDKEEVKRFLVRMFEEDEEHQDFIAGILDKTGDKRMLELFKIGLELSKRIGDKYTYNDIKWSYFYLDRGINKDFGNLWKKKWDERWKPQLEELDMTEKEIEDRNKKSFLELDKRIKDLSISKEEKQEMKDFDNLEILPFNMEKYLEIREWNEPLHEFYKVLVLLGLTGNCSMEKLQLLISQTRNQDEVLNKILNNYMFRSQETMHIFADTFSEVWNSTPREEFNGLSPDQVNRIKFTGLN